MLPFNDDPPIRSRLYCAYPTGILSSSGALPSSVFSLYIQLHFPFEKLKNRSSIACLEFFPARDFWQFEALGYFRFTEFDEQRVVATDRSALIHELIATLDRGSYLLVYVNEFFIPKSDSFLLHDFRREHLIVGYDPAEGCFIGRGYLRDGTFGNTRISFPVLVEAILSPGGRIPSRPWTNKVIIRGIEPVVPPTATPDRHLIARQLSDYLSGVNNAPEYLYGAYSTSVNDALRKHYAVINGAFGTGIYPVLRQYIEANFFEPTSIDLVATRTIWEHKKMVRHCLALLFDRPEDERNVLVSAYDEMIALAHKLHLTSFALSKQPGKVDVERILRLVDDLAEREHDVLSAVLTRCA